MITARYISILFFLGCATIGYSQEDDPVELESLKEVYYAQPEGDNKAQILIEIAEKETFPDSAIKYNNMLLESARFIDSLNLLQRAYQRMGVNWRLKGEFDKSLEFLFKSAGVAEDMQDLIKVGMVNVEIGNTYSESGNFSHSATYYDRALDFLRESGDTIILGMALQNVGDDLIEKGQLDSALVYTREAREIFQHFNKDVYEAYSLGNLGRIYARQGDNRRGERYLDEAIVILEEVEDYNAITDFLSSMASIYARRGDYRAAITYAERSLKAAETHHLKADLEKVHLMLSKLYEQAGNVPEAFTHFKQHVTFKDSIRNLAVVREMADQRTNFEIARKQTEVDLLNEQKANQRNIVVAIGVALFLIMLLALGLYRRNKYIGRTKRIIENEKNRSDLLLLNILPQETALELKEKGKVEAKRFEAVTVLFTDFKNFTHYAENLPPEELVKSVDFYFSKFDEIVDRHGLEKIKTVGDAYMCASGVPFPVEDHAYRVIAAACDMINFVKNARRVEDGKETRFEVRIGINSGPVVAGVVGNKKWAYDIWGDAVNIAARMETCSEIGKINISENTYDLVKESYDCDFRGEIEVKNKGMMKMYFVKGLREAKQSNVA